MACARTRRRASTVQLSTVWEPRELSPNTADFSAVGTRALLPFHRTHGYPLDRAPFGRVSREWYFTSRNVILTTDRQDPILQRTLRDPRTRGTWVVSRKRHTLVLPDDCCQKGLTLTFALLPEQRANVRSGLLCALNDQRRTTRLYNGNRPSDRRGPGLIGHKGRNVRSTCRCSHNLRITRRRAVSCGLHRPTSQVIHRSGFSDIHRCVKFFYERKSPPYDDDEAVMRSN